MSATRPGYAGRADKTKAYKECAMRLTVHHGADVLPVWLDSLNKLLASDGFNPAQFRHLGEWHLATFNDRIVGLAISDGEELRYFAVRDVTRRRGVGEYLLNETLSWMHAQGCSQAILSIHAVRQEERDGLAAFLLKHGFQRNGERFLKTLNR